MERFYFSNLVLKHPVLQLRYYKFRLIKIIKIQYVQSIYLILFCIIYYYKTKNFCEK